MARQRKLTPERKTFINGLLEHYKPETAQDVQEMLKNLLGDTLQVMPYSHRLRYSGALSIRCALPQSLFHIRILSLSWLI